jgi:hypothetical protein
MLITAKDGLMSHDMDTFASIIKIWVYVLETSQEIYYTAYNRKSHIFPFFYFQE